MARETACETSFSETATSTLLQAEEPEIPDWALSMDSAFVKNGFVHGFVRETFKKEKMFLWCSRHHRSNGIKSTLEVLKRSLNVAVMTTKSGIYRASIFLPYSTAFLDSLGKVYQHTIATVRI